MTAVTKATFNNKNSYFFEALKQRIDAYFENNKIKQSGNSRLFTKAILLITTLIILYITLVFYTPSSAILSLFLCAMMGVNFAAIGFNIMHDGAHGSFSTKPWVNEMMSHSLEMMGGSSFMWKVKHNQNHHTFTNIEGMDDDIDIKPFIRVSADQPKKWYHRFQHVYSFLLYALTYFFWIFWLDFKKYFTGRIGELKIKKMNPKDHIVFWASKIIYILVFLVIPIYRVGVVETFIGYGVVLIITGLIISVVFQLAHIVEGTIFPAGNDDSKSLKIETEWAIHQLNTTANFATKNKFVSWFVGGLNFQVEHHLFPKISHVHYPEISKLVKETCAQFNVNYLEFPTVLSAIKSHVVHLKHVGVAA
jgi:linoleoyl-CoA desaturase